MAKLPKIKLPTITNEQWVLALLFVAPPVIGYIYFDWRAAITAFAVTQIVLGIVKERFSN